MLQKTQEGQALQKVPQTKKGKSAIEHGISIVSGGN
jgi:hypothetical protein